ncbi:aldehyde ferredoxin oxidoreductase family protein [Candidatus Bathyarchaeota archaeon]|nr:aldehyde ferredoxin oxidoreductase family protein [Candidatus Bathyarchaeota archaeon]
MVSGYAGKILRVDLTAQSISTEQLGEDDLRRFIGGSGLGSKIVYSELDPDIHPLSPENLLVFMTGPLTGTASPSSGRYCVCTKSPLTGLWAEAHAAGYWGPELKFAGFDGVILEGRAESPLYLSIVDGQADLRDASKLWGRDTYTTETLLREELKDESLKVASIGQAGERGVLFASIMNDYGRAAGRCGVGAVMGSKNLKAIAVRGTRLKVIPAAKDSMLNEFLRRIYVTIRSYPTTQIYASYGTDGIMSMMHEYGDVPIKYFTRGSWPQGIEKISGEAMAKTILKRQWACYRCLIACGRQVIIQGSGPDREGAGPEYETCASLGALCLNSDLNVIAAGNDLCNRYGIDTISAGSVIAFAMECYEKGLISTKDTGGLALDWGDGEVIIKLLNQIGLNQGFGAVLAKGVRSAAAEIGGSAQDFALHVKGLEMPMHDPRAFKGLGLQYATSHRGACHLRGLVYHVEQGERIPDLGIHKRYQRLTTEDKAFPVIALQNWHDVLDSLIMCKFAMLPPASVLSILNMVTGWEMTLQELLRVGERTYNLKRVFNLECGATRDDDTLPKRFLKEPLDEGGSRGEIVDLEPMLSDYYRLRGWDADGIPTSQKLEELGLNKLVAV